MSQLFVIAQAAGQRIAFDAVCVESVIDIDAVIPAPLAAAHVVGLCAVRSLVLTVVDVAAAVGLPAETEAKRAIVIELDGHRYALRVAAVEDVMPQTGVVEPVDASIGANWFAAACGRIATGNAFALLLDPAQIIAPIKLKLAC